jgi:PAS domain S-box-containing protein
MAAKRKTPKRTGPKRKGSEEALREQATKFRIISENTYDFEAWISPEGQYLYASPSCERITGYLPEEFLKDPCMLLRSVHPDDRAAFEEHIREVENRETAGELEYRILHKDGSVRWIAHACQPVYEGGRFLGKRVSNRDITDRKRAEERLARQATMLEHVHDAVIGFDTDLHITSWNEGAERLYGYTQQEVLGRLATEVLRSEYIGTGRDEVMSRLWRDGYLGSELVHHAKDGRRIHVETRTVVVKDDRGEPIALLAVNRDVTDRKRAEEALREAKDNLETRVRERTAELERANLTLQEEIAERRRMQDQLHAASLYARSLLEASLDPLVTISPQGKITDVNRATEAATGVSRERLIGSDFSDYFTEPEKARQGYRKVLSDGEVRDYPLTVRHASGRTMDVLYNATLYRSEAGEVQGVFAAARDVTDRRRAEEAVQAERQRLYNVLETLPVYVVLLSPDYHVPFANRFFEERFGESGGKRCFEYLFHRTEPCDDCETFKVLETGAPHHWEWTGPDGRNYDIYDFPFTDSDGSPFIMEMGIDVTEQKRAEAELRRHQEHLEDLVEERTAEVAKRNTELAAEVAERKRAEEALRESEARLRLQIERMPIACLLHGADFRITAWNPAAVRLFGFTAEEAMGKHPCHLIVAPEARDRVRAVFDRLAIGDMAAHSVNENVTKDGRTVLCEWTNTPIRGHDGRVAAVLSMAQDVTERERIEQALRESRGDLARAQEVGQIGSWRLDTRRNILTWSDENHCIFGIPEGTPMTYETFLATIHPDDRACVDEKWQAGLRGEPYDVEHRIVVDGQVKWVREKAYLEFDDAGKLLGGFGITQDITERKAAEVALRKAHDRAAWLGRFPEENPNPVVRADADGTILYANPPARELPAWSVEVGQPLQPALLTLVREALAEGRERQEEMPLGKRFYNVTVAPFPQEGYANIYAEDCTDRKRAEDALRRSRDVLERRVEQRTEELTDTVEQLRAEAARRELAEDALQKTNEDLRRRAAQLARLASELTVAEQKERRRLAEILHDDLQQVLVGTKYHLELAANWAGADQRIVRMVEQAGALLAEAVQKARSLSHELSPPTLRQQGLVSGLEWLARQMKEKHGLAVAVAWEGAVEPVSEAIGILVYKAVQEMLFNVAKHAGVREAEVRVRRNDNRLEVSVADRGKGFDPASVAPDREIRTFGLFNIRERAGLMGGRLDIQSEPGRGSTFVLHIPDREQPTDEQEPPADEARPADEHAAPAAEPAAAGGAVLRVLLVDDHPVMRQGLALLLAEEPDLTVVGEADNGKDAIDLVGRLRPDVVVMDVSMPVMDGIEATQVIKREWPEVRVVGLSMFDEADLCRDMLEAGADAYLPKAGPSQDLLAAIRCRQA